MQWSRFCFCEEGEILWCNANRNSRALIYNSLRILYFGSPVCHKCKMIEPKLEALIRNRSLNLTKVDASREVDIAVKYDVMSLPTLIFLLGDNEVKRLTSAEVSLIAIEKACAELSEEEKMGASEI